MNNSDMLALSDNYKTLKDEKNKLQEQLKDIEAKLEKAEALLIEAMVSEECDGFKRSGSNFSLVVKEFPGPVPDRKEALYAAMREHGFDHLFSINSLTLSATVKELKANNDDILPEWLEGLIKIYERPSIRVTKSK